MQIPLLLAKLYHKENNKTQQSYLHKSSTKEQKIIMELTRPNKVVNKVGKGRGRGLTFFILVQVKINNEKING
jgi:hypothetical protein